VAKLAWASLDVGEVPPDRGQSSAEPVDHHNMQAGTGSSTSMSATHGSNRRRVAPIQGPKLNLYIDDSSGTLFDQF
jgi:hypothetical protein